MKDEVQRVTMETKLWVRFVRRRAVHGPRVRAVTEHLVINTINTDEQMEPQGYTTASRGRSSPVRRAEQTPLHQPVEVQADHDEGHAPPALPITGLIRDQDPNVSRGEPKYTRLLTLQTPTRKPDTCTRLISWSLPTTWSGRGCTCSSNSRERQQDLMET